VELVARKIIDIRSSIPKHPTRRWQTRSTADKIIVHTSASDNQDPNKTARYHITPGPQNHISTKGAPGLCYADFITKEGVIYHCNSYQDITWHAGSYNTRSIGVVLAYKGQDKIPPVEAQYTALLEHLVILCLYLNISPENVIGHREVPGMFTILGNGSKKYKKVCPGMGLNLDKMRQELTARIQRRLSCENLYTGIISTNTNKQMKESMNLFIDQVRHQIKWKYSR